MAIDSTSSLDDVVAQYMNNLNWEGDPVKAKDCLAAVRALLVIRPTKLMFLGQEVSFDMGNLRSLEKSLSTYISSVPSTSNKCFIMRGRLR